MVTEMLGRAVKHTQLLLEPIARYWYLALDGRHRAAQHCHGLSPLSVEAMKSSTSEGFSPGVYNC